MIIIFINGCSTKKNTWISRFYQATNTRFNVFFNGMNSYEDGLKNIEKANQEDYSTIIPMYPISRHSNAKAATANMDRTIEKCRKAIKLHSIKVKPKKNYKKANSPEYKLFYNQQEFNPALKDAWLLLAKAEFHKADFLGSAATFSYIARHYTNDKDVETVCQLWKARAYAEMSWIFEAEQVLSKLDQNNLKPEDIGLFASVNADLLLKKRQYKEAIPFLALALSKEKDKDLKQRFSFLLAQLYQKTGNDKAAFEAYTSVIKMNPPYEMDFNARISRAQIDKGNVQSVRKDLKKMLKNPNNKDYLDQLYFALAKTYLNHSDTVRAIENYKLSIEKSTRNGIDKAVTLITLGDLYYSKRKYILAQPCYDDASKIITNEQNDYDRVTNRAETLAELVTQNNVVELQDSLQRLAAMPENKRLEVVTKLIEKLEADEKAAAQKQLEKAANPNSDEDFANQPPIGGNLPGSAGDWYFYNPNLMRSGKSDFLKKWGNRKLEDNWRRTNKATSLFADDATASISSTDSTDTIAKTAASSDFKDPQFYLKQIPVTAAQIAGSNAEIATALYNMGLIFKDKIEDIPMAISTFEAFIRRFGSDERVPDAYYQLYVMETMQNNAGGADLYRTKLMTEFPDSKYQKILSQPDYAARQERMYKEQDSIYSITYKAFSESKFDTVFNNVAYIQHNYPLSTLMPKFLFLNALSIGKRDPSEKFETALSDLIKSYPESDVSAMSKDILALMKQGRETQLGTSSGTLLARRDSDMKSEETNKNPELQFSTERQSKHRLLLITPTNQDHLNKLLYNIASFNFSRFMIKDFDLVISKLDTVRSTLSVTNFESYDEVDWYAKSLATDPTIMKLLNDYQVQEVIISEDNYALLKTSFSLNDYLAFQSRPVDAKQIEMAAVTKSGKKNDVIVVQKDKLPKNEVGTVTKTTEKASQIEKVEKPVENPVKTNPAKATNEVKTDKTTADVSALTKEEPAIKPVEPVVTQPKDEAPLFKGLFTYRSNEPHYIAIYILSGTIDFEKTKAAFDAYNAKNYGVMNLKVSLETVDKQQIIIIGSLSDAYVAKSYLMHMVKEKSLFEGLKNANYRNILGSHQNLNILMQQNALKTYFEFMQEYYLK